MSYYALQQRDCLMENVQTTTKDNEITDLHWLLIDLEANGYLMLTVQMKNWNFQRRKQEQ